MSFRQVSWYTLLQLGIVFVRSRYLRDRHETELFIALRRGCGSSWILLVILTCKKTCKVQYQPWACCVCRQKVLHVLNMFHSNKRKFYFETWQFSVIPLQFQVLSSHVSWHCTAVCIVSVINFMLFVLPSVSMHGALHLFIYRDIFTIAQVKRYFLLILALYNIMLVLCNAAAAVDN